MMMKDRQVHALRACSLVAILPSEERTPPPGGFPRDLSGMNLTSWASLIQDVAQGMKVVPPNLSMEVCLDSMVLLQLLEATTGMGYCRICCQPSPQCRCPGDYQQAPTETWSQMMARMPGQGVAASIGGPTTSGTATTEVQEQGVPPPPPGLQPPDFTNWSLPLTEAPATGTTDAFRRSARHWKTDSRPTGLGSKGPGTAYAGAKHSPGNAASSSAETAPACHTLPAGSAATEPACYSLSAGSAATEPARCSLQAANTAIEPACYTVPAGCAAAQEAGREGIVSPTSLRQSRSCTRPKHPRPWKATGQGTGHQRQISQLPRTRPRDDNQHSLDYQPGRHAISTWPSFPAQTPRSGRDGGKILQQWMEKGP